MLTKLPLSALRVRIVLLTLIIFGYSCKKEPDLTSEDRMPESIRDFRTWFAAKSIDQSVRVGGFKNYAGSGGQIKLEPLAGNAAERGTPNHLSLMPEWDQAVTYRKGDSTIAEVPVNKRSSIAFALNASAGRFDFSRSASVTRFLFIKTPVKTRGTYMTIIGAESYLKGDKSKLAKNTLRKKDTEFTGMVLYHSLQGYFLNGYVYERGKVVDRLTPRLVAKHEGQAASKGFEKLQNAVPNCETYYVTQYYEQCTDWYNGGGSYMYTTCNYWSETSYYDVCTYSSGSSGGGGGPPPPGDGGPDDPCDGNGGGGIGSINANGDRVMIIIPGCEGEPTPDPWDPNNDLPLPCEYATEQDMLDTIQVQNPIAQLGLEMMLPYQYHSYVKFDSKGNLNNALLQSAAGNSSLPSSQIYQALVFLTQQPNIDVKVYLTHNWWAKTATDTAGRGYSWTSTQQSLEGITIIPGAVPMAGVPVTGDPTTGHIFIKEGLKNNLSRLAFVAAHELLGHMYQYIKGLPWTEGDPTFMSWRAAIESEANKNWRLMKKWEKSKNECP